MNRQTIRDDWFRAGFAEGRRFAREEAEYAELAAVVRARGIPLNWDIFRAEILNRFLGTPAFDFRSYEAGFLRACVEFFDAI